MNVKIKRLHTNSILPSYQTPGSAGFDLHATEFTHIRPGETALVGTGLAFELAEGTELQIRPRSGLTARTKLRVALGTVDTDYRGEVKIICENTGTENIIIQAADRIAQGIIAPVIQVSFVEEEELSSTERGEGGFGSTNK